tara:strand:- start:541 stop:960 length:420 start_codon:yes stop_codon:yes gene_type:complete
MKTENQHHIDWLASNEGLLNTQDKIALDSFVLSKPKIQAKWIFENELICTLSRFEPSISDDFNSRVLKAVTNTYSAGSDISYSYITVLGLTAAVLLMLNLFIAQNSWSFDAIIGLADLDSGSLNILLNEFQIKYIDYAN